MTKRKSPTYFPEFRLEVAQQVVDANRLVGEVAGSLGKSTVDKWARQFREERNGNLSSATPLGPDQLKIRELERKLKGLKKIILSPKRLKYDFSTVYNLHIF